MDLETVGYLCETAARLDSTVPNSKNISRHLRETCVTRFYRLRLEEVLGESQVCPMCFSPWSSGRFSLRLQSCTKADKKKSLVKLLRKKPSSLNRYQKALLDRIRSGATSNVMRLTCLECNRVTKKYVTKSTPLEGKGLLDETKPLENAPIVVQEEAPVKKKKKKRKKDATCGLKSSVVAKVRQSKAQVLKTSLKVDCVSRVPPSNNTDSSIVEKESDILTNTLPNSEDYYLTDKLPYVSNNNDLSQKINLKITSKEQNSVKSDIGTTVAEDFSTTLSPMLKIKKSDNKIDNLFDQLTEISLNVANKTESTATTHSFSKGVTKSKKAGDCEESLNRNKRFKNNPDVIDDNHQGLESKLKLSGIISDENLINESESSEIISNNENKSESTVTDSDKMNESTSSGKKKRNKESKKTANNIKINLLSQPSLNNMLQSNVCTNLNENKNQRNSKDLSIRNLNEKTRSNIDTKINNNNKGNNNPKQCSLAAINRQQTKNKKNNNKKQRNNRLLNKRTNNNRVFEELNCRNSLCVKDLLNLT